MNGDVHLITVGRRLVSRKLGSQCRNERAGEGGRFPNAFDIQKLLSWGI